MNNINIIIKIYRNKRKYKKVEISLLLKYIDT